MNQIGTAVAADAINKLIVAPLLQQIDDVIHLGRNRGDLQAKLLRMKLLLQGISDAFQNQQRTPPQAIRDCLESTRDAIGEARSLIDRSQLQQRCLDCIICKPRISRDIRDWNSRFDQLLQDLQTLFSIFANAHQIASSSAQPPAKELLQPLPEWGIVGMDIQSAETQLQTWINAEAPQFRIIAVFGMAGVGKTTLLKSVYNFYKVSDAFDVVIWVTVSQHYQISELHRCIAKEINLDISRTSDIDNRKIMLSASLKNKKFLLILDDMWTALDFQELGVAFVTDKASKVVFSTCSRELALEEGKVSIKVEPLSRKEGWDLFQRTAFRGSPVPEELKDCARKIADECEGLPLAIIVVATAMSSKRTVDEWSSSLSLMKNADPSFPETHPRVDQQLYRRLRRSYDELSKTPNLQNCFLYCALFPEDHQIDVEQLVLMWIAEGFVKSKEGTFSKDLHLGYRYVKLLIDRGLFQNSSFEKQNNDIIVNKPVDVWKERNITVHDVIRDMAVYIGEKEDNYLCRAGQQLKDFPCGQIQADCKRISLFSNQIESLPEDFPCPNLVSLMLSENPYFHNIPESFMMNLTSLRVLDLSDTRELKSVPTSLTQLALLEFLNLRRTAIKELPEDIGKLTQLQYLNLRWCHSLISLPCSIGKLKQLQYMDLWDCPKLVLPPEISQVTSLRRLALNIGSNIGSLTVGTWSEMEHLVLSHRTDGDLPPEIQIMKKLQSLRIIDYRGVNLPNWICDFQQLERLELWSCPNLDKLPSLERLPNLKFLKLDHCAEVQSLEIGSSGNLGEFPMYEEATKFGGVII